MQLHQRTEARMEFSDEPWDHDAVEYGEELQEAIQKAQDDHEEEIIVEPDESPYILRVGWNPTTQTVWVAVFAYRLGLEVSE